MTLMELLLALAILSLIAAISFSTIGPGLRESRRAGEEAAFWRAVPSAQLLLSELAASAIDVSDTVTITPAQVRLRAYAPRFADAPIDVALNIACEEDICRLLMLANGRQSVVLEEAPPLRFAQRIERDAIALEVRARRAWAPLSIAPLRADGPLVCVFDSISRDCR